MVFPPGVLLQPSLNPIPNEQLLMVMRNMDMQKANRVMVQSFFVAMKSDNAW
jgi:hypothetical protein